MCSTHCIDNCAGYITFKEGICLLMLLTQHVRSYLIPKIKLKTLFWYRNEVVSSFLVSKLRRKSDDSVNKQRPPKLRSLLYFQYSISLYFAAKAL